MKKTILMMMLLFAAVLSPAAVPAEGDCKRGGR